MIIKSLNRLTYDEHSLNLDDLACTRFCPSRNKGNIYDFEEMALCFRNCRCRGNRY